MSRTTPRSLLVLSLLALLLAAAPAAAQAPDLQSFNSRFYEVHTNLRRDEVIDFARHMDLVFAQYLHKFSGFRSSRRGSMPLYLLRTQEDYLAFMAGQGIDASNSGGMFFVRGDASGLVTWTEGRGRTEVFAVLQHEGFHQFAYDYLGRELPVWMNEGMAEYFEQGIIVRDDMKLGLADPQRIGLVRRAIEQERAIPFETLVGISNAEWGSTLRSDPERATLLYAQSWSVIHFLVHADGGRYARALTHYLQLISRGRTSDKAFREVFGVDDLGPAEARWRAYISELTPDPLDMATSRLAFLGAALSHLHELDLEMPKSLDELKAQLQSRQFRLVRRSHGHEEELTADDESLYQFTRDNGSAAPFKLLPPHRSDVPPRITAPGIRPTPTLVWSVEDDGPPTYDIEYR